MINTLKSFGIKSGLDKKKRSFTLPVVFLKNSAQLYQGNFLFQTLVYAVMQLSTILVLKNISCIDFLDNIHACLRFHELLNI